MNLIAYDSPMWFYVVMVPVMVAMGFVMVALGVAILRETRKDKV